MPFRWSPHEQFSLGTHLVKWLVIVAPVATIIGSACALFLWLLDVATTTRWNNEWLLYLLPVAGVAVGALYHWLGRSVEGGNNLIMDQIHEAGGGVPGRMAPLVLIGTIITHLFGGSAGREGTAVQMGGSIASVVGRTFKLSGIDMRVILMAGIAAGFGAVFGTPLTGAIFAIEVLTIGRIQYEALLPCLMASVIGDLTCTAWGIHHTYYHIAATSTLTTGTQVEWLLLGEVALAGVAFGLMSQLFAEMTHGLHRIFQWMIPIPMLRPVLGGLLVIGLTLLLGTQDYLGLGVTSPDPHSVTILSAFAPGGATPLSWWWKALFTAVTLSSGFKGGEVTPLFFIGATLGNVLASLLGAPVDLFAGLGFVAVFAGATNTPLACTMMGIELFGADHAIFIAVACFVAYLFSGHSGIYLSQRIETPKGASPGIPSGVSLRTVREFQPSLREFIASRATSITTRNDQPFTIEGSTVMPQRRRVHSKEIGQLRIYLAARERRKTTGIRERLKSKPLYQEVIDVARQSGILNALAHPTHYGYSGNGVVQNDYATDAPNPNLNMCVELIGQRDQLEKFCQTHADLLHGKVIVYKHMEHWEVTEHGLEEADLTEEELRDTPEDEV